MKLLLHTHFLQRLLYVALPLALCLVFLFPATSEAHAILLRSDPAQDAVLNTAPSQVRMWFSEDLNPTFSTAIVVNGSNQHVDGKDAHVSSSDTREMDLSLQPNLPAGSYVVVWRTQSADDGHVLSGSFIFSVAAADGTVPKFNGAVPGQNDLGGSSSTSASSGQLDAPTLFSFIMVTLVDLGAVFWVGIQLWRTFVHQLSEEEDSEQKAIQQREEQRSERIFSLPALLVVGIANLGVLLGQGLLITGGRLDQALSLTVLKGLASNGRFGTYWTVREIVVVLALLVATYMLLAKQRSRLINELISWANLILGLALLIALTLSGHAAATSNTILVYAVLVDWLHLLAAALWIGGMMYISTIYLPALKGNLWSERARSLLTVLPRFSPLAIAGVIIMAISGPFNATVHMSSWDQLITTAYGRTLTVKVLLVCALLLTSAIHVRFFRPRLRDVYKKYTASLAPSLPDTEIKEESKDAEGTEDKEVIASAPGTTEQIKLLEVEVARQTTRLTRTLRWEPLLGVAVLVCTGLLNVFAGTLLPAANQTSQPIQSSSTQQSAPLGKPFSTTAKTTDNKFTIQIQVSPNRFGPNVFTAHVLDSAGKPDANVGVSIYTTMLDMDMGTQALNLQPDGKGGFSANGDLDMGGHWQLRIQIRTPDNALHEVKIKMLTPE